MRRVVEEVARGVLRSIAIRDYKKYAKKNQGVIKINNSSMDRVLRMIKLDITMMSSRVRAGIVEDSSAKGLIEKYKAEQELVLSSNRLIESAIQIVTELGLITDPIELTINYNSDINNGYHGCINSKINKDKAYCHTICVETSIGSIDSIMGQEDSEFLKIINKLYDVNIDPTRIDYDMLFTFLHELGHYHDRINNVTRFNDKAREQQLDIANLLYASSVLLETNDYAQEDYDIAYRQMPDEAYADKFAIDILKRYYPEILDSNK
jgi:hypothetical protein